ADALRSRFRARADDRLGAAAGRSAGILVAGALVLAAGAASQGHRFGPAAVLTVAAALVGLWHRREPRWLTAWTGSIAFSAAAALVAMRFASAAGLGHGLAALAALALALAALRNDGE